MASEYDALLAPEQPKASEYDALLASTADKAVAQEFSSANPAGYLEDKILSGLGIGQRGREILANAEYGLAKTGRELIPQSLSQVLGFATPVLGAVEDIRKTAGTLSDVISGKTFEESMRANRPEDFALSDAEKTPAFSKERFAAGFGTVAQMLMGAGIVHGLTTPHPSLTETLFPEAIENRKSPIAIPPEEVTQHAQQITEAAQPDGVRPEPQVPPATQEPAVPQSSEGIPESRQGPQVQEVAPPVTGEPIEQAPMAEVTAPEPKLVPDARFGRNEDIGNIVSIFRSEDSSGVGNSSPESVSKIGKFYSTSKRGSDPYLKEGRSAVHDELAPDAVGYSTNLNKHNLAKSLGLIDDAFEQQGNKRVSDGEITAAQYHDQIDQKLASYFKQHGVDYYVINNGAELVVLNDKAVTQRHSETRVTAPKTQTEDLKLVGEQGTDHAARAAAEEKAAAQKSEYDALTEAAQGKLFEPSSVPSVSSDLSHDWTGATATEPGKGMRLSQKASQAGLTINPLASPIVQKALKTIEIRKMQPLDAATTERSARLQQSFADAERAQKEIAKVAPTERRQSAISLWMEANGDAQTLSQWAAAAKGKAFREAATAAQNLTSAELAIAQKARAAFDVLEKRGNTYDVLSNHRDNYVPHVWEVTKDFTGIGSSKLQDRFKFNKARTFNNFFEGDQAGFTPKTMAIGKLLPAYLHEMNKVIADRQFIQDLQAKGATASDGSPLVIPRGRVSTIETDAGGKAYLADPNAYKNAKDAAGNPIDQSKYKVIGDQPALNDWRWESKDEAGNPIYMKDDLAVHPELAKRLNATMGQSAIRQWYNEPSSGVSVIPKAIAKGLDTAQSVMKREMFSLLAPFHQVQEGTHAIGHTVNPFGGLEDMSRPTPEHVDAMQHGLMLLPDRSSSAAYIEGLGGRGGFIAQAGRWLGEKAGENVIGKAADKIASVVDGYQNYLFHQYIPALKFKTYQHILERNMARYVDDLKSGHVTEADVKLLSAEQSNAAYGHLNYALLDRNPTMQHITQLALLAPDFLEARGRFVAQAAKSLIGEKAGHEQFRAIAVLAAAQAATMFTLSQVLGGEWDWKHPFEMTVGNRRYMLRSVPEDLHRLLFQGPDVRREFVSARINPTLQKVDQLRTGLNYRGEKTGALETMGELFANYIPITARSIPGVRRLTETSRNSPISPLEQLAGSLGLKISRYSAITHTHQLASEWMEKQKIERPAGVYPTSKFTPLRYALEDADLPRAEKEWKKLVGDEGDDKKLAEGFKSSITHPFTGNKSRDQDFANSLKGKDRLLYERALEVREGILDKFSLIH